MHSGHREEAAQQAVGIVLEHFVHSKTTPEGGGPHAAEEAAAWRFCRAPVTSWTGTTLPLRKCPFALGALASTKMSINGLLEQMICLCLCNILSGKAGIGC